MLDCNLIKIFEESFRNNHDAPALTDYFKKETLTYFDVAQDIAKLHLMFKNAGIERGDKIALIGRNNTRWCMSYLATVTYGAVIVPILQDFNPNDVVNIINHSESKLLFLGDNFWDDIEAEQIPAIKAVFSLTDFHVIYEREGNAITDFITNINVHFNKAYPKGFTTEDIAYDVVPNDQLCLLNYTSGTTGSSKGVMLTVNNLTGNVIFARDMVNPKNGLHFFRAGGRTLSFLPLAHAFGCAFDFLAPMACGIHVTLLGRIPSPKILIEAMKSVRPNIVCSVPMILEKVYRKSILPMLEKTPMSIAMRIPLINTAIYSTILSRLMEQFGGCVEIFIVGGAALNKETEDFLRKIKFPLTVGYGMTECAPLLSYAPWYSFKAGSCGRSVDGLELRIDSDNPQKKVGEIQAKGPNVMIGYYKNEEATKAAFTEDGFLRTGDLGIIDKQGNVFIKGRSKCMILTASGQNIYPEEIEAVLNTLPHIAESLIVARDKALVALVALSADDLALDEATINAELEQTRLMANEILPAYSQVTKIEIVREGFAHTPKQSIKRFLYN